MAGYSFPRAGALFHFIRVHTTLHTHANCNSSVSSVRRILSSRARESTTNSKMRASTTVLGVAPLFTRALPSLTADAGGQHFLMVSSPMRIVSLICRILNVMWRRSAIPGAVHRHNDHSMGIVRTEITCAACGGHLGHVFKGEGFNTPSKSSCTPRHALPPRATSRNTATPRSCICFLHWHTDYPGHLPPTTRIRVQADERHCVNSISLSFREDKE